MLLPFTMSQCQKKVDLSPCKYTETDGQSTLSCWGNMPLPRLTTILRDLMCGKNISKFELLATNITYLPSNLFLKVIVSEINVYSAYIRHFTVDEESAFNGLEDILLSLSMRRCFLKDRLQWQMLSQMYALSYLDLSYNELTSIPTQWMDRPPPNLRSLLLKGNKISSLEPGALKWMYSLVELDLSENQIKSFSRAALPLSGKSLIVLRLSYNRLENMPEGSFNELFGLRRLYLDNNNITRLEESTWRPIWGDLDALDLNDNNIQCDHDIYWTTKLHSPVRLYGECVDPNFLGKHLRSLTVDDFEL